MSYGLFIKVYAGYGHFNTLDQILRVIQVRDVESEVSDRSLSEAISRTMTHSSRQAVSSFNKLIDTFGDRALNSLEDIDQSILRDFIANGSDADQAKLRSKLANYLDDANTADEELTVEEIEQALDTLSETANFEALEIVTDNLSEQQIRNVEGDVVTQVISNIVHAETDAGVITDAVRDIVETFGENVPAHAIEIAIDQLSTSENESGLRAIVDNLSEGMIEQIDARFVDLLGRWGFDLNGNNDSVADQLLDAANAEDFDALAEVVDNASATDLANLDRDTVNNLADQGIKIGADGHDFLYTNDTLILGGDGNDVVISRSDDVHLYGGDGSDTLYGGNGADTFVFKAGEEGTDRIWQFNSSQGDKIDLSDYLDGRNISQDAIDDFVSIREEGRDTIVSVRVEDGGTQDIARLSFARGEATLDDIVTTTLPTDIV